MKEVGEVKPVIAYPIGAALYLNITNCCPNDCIFCIRNTKKGVGYNLWLAKKPEVEEIIEALGDLNAFQEVVFCGYGEPLLRPEIIVAVASFIKANYAIKIRINTNGLADLFLKEDILPQLQGLIDEISISLNAHNTATYQKLTHSPFGKKAFGAVIKFTKRCKYYIGKVILSVVKYPEVDFEKAAEIAQGLGVEFRIRQYQD